MRLTRKALIQFLADGCFLQKGQKTNPGREVSFYKATRAVDAILSTFKKTLAEGEEIRLIGFGTFSVQAYPERQARNPKTGLPLTVKASKRIRFRPGKVLKDAVSGEKKPTPPVKEAPKTKGKVQPKSSLDKKK